MIIIGLGNPGSEYFNTRHNIGFDIVDFIKNEIFNSPNEPWETKEKLQSEIFEKNIDGRKIILQKPTTFMNESGFAVQKTIKFYKKQIPEIIVIHDDIDLPLGNYKIQTNRSSAGHNGVRSIITQLGTQDFLRLRIGIGRENRESQGDTANFVLKKFNIAEKLKLRSVRQQVGEEIKDILGI
ncbi:MAG: aminoacyl-tRNA hydrolase [Patescibacteria group bacterium]